MVSRKLAITGTVAACAACCAPLVVPIIWPVLIAAGLVGTGGAGGGWLAGDAFTVADLNVAAVMHLMKMIDFTYAEHANVQRWADACYARPALARALARP